MQIAQLVNLIALVSVPAMTILAFNADFIIHLVFGQKWGTKVGFFGDGYFWLAGVKILAAIPASGPLPFL